jgi:fucose 4-O-acetylase-like acetyltransferase
VAPGLVLYLVQLLRGVYLYLNLLGMPTFTLISGYCSKVRTKRKHPR